MLRTETTEKKLTRDITVRQVLILLLVPLAVLLLSQFITIQSVGGTLEWIVSHPGPVGRGWLVLTLFLLLFYGVIGRLFWACAFQTVVCCILSFVSFYENMVNGVPLRVSDLFMVSAAGSLVGFLRALRPTAAGVTAVVLGVGLLALLYRVGGKCQKPEKRIRIVMALGAVGLILAVTLPSIRSVPLWDREETTAETYRREGFLLGLYNSIAPTEVQAPKNYSQTQMEQLLDDLPGDAPGETVGSETQPTVIFFMSESFFDVSRLPNVTYSTDPVPVYHSLAKKYTSGTFFSNTYGGGTGNVEMEVFTGLSSFMLGVQVTPTTLDVELYDSLPSLVKVLKAQGYQTAAVHSYTNELYNRAETFPAIGFDKLYFEDSFPETAQYKGGYISDEALIDQAISVYEHRDPDKPMFLYVLSMENHQPYPADKFDTPSGVKMESKGLTEEEQGILNTIVTGIHDADASLGQLVRYFANKEEPVIIVFWGDHLPSLYTGTETGTVYSSLGYVGADDLEGLTVDELKKMVSTNYLIWTNYEEEPLPDRDTSSWMLGVQVLDRLGLKKTPFFSYVNRLGDDMLLFRERLFLRADGTASKTIPEELMPEIEQYGALLYDMLYGEQYITELLNTLP